MVVNQKGSGANGIVARVIKIIRSLGHNTLILRSDQEPAMKDMQEEVREQRIRDLSEISNRISGEMDAGAPERWTG